MATMIDLSAPSPKRSRRKDNPFDADVSRDTDVNAVRRVKQACETVLGECAELVEYSLLDYDQMNFVLRCERFYKDNKHLGMHWLHQLRRLAFSKRNQLGEARVKARLID